MSSLDLPQYLLELLDRILKVNDFKEYSMQKNTEYSMKGSGSDLFTIDITDLLCEKKLNVVSKTASCDKNRRKNFLSSHNFVREAVFYEKIQPMFLKFQEEKNLPKFNRFLSHPKCYGSLIDHDNEQYAIVLDNLREYGFRMWNKFNPAPIENIRLVMRELGKFHGISFAMKDQHPEKFAELKLLRDTFQNLTETQIVRDRFNDSFDCAIKSLRIDEHKNIIRDVKENFSMYLEYCVKHATTDRFGVLSHGDLWNNNLMYHFNNEGIADDVCILDWQFVRYTSPALDLLCNIFSSTDKSLRDKEYMNLLHLYHESLSKMVKLLGSNPEKLFTFENLQDELKKCGNYALLVAPIVIAVSTGAISDLDETFNNIANGKVRRNSVCNVNNDSDSQLQFKKRLEGLLEDINSFGYYRKMN